MQLAQQPDLFLRQRLEFRGNSLEPADDLSQVIYHVSSEGSRAVRGTCHDVSPCLSMNRQPEILPKVLAVLNNPL